MTCGLSVTEESESAVLDDAALIEVLQKIELNLSEFSSLQTEFVQEKHLSIFSDPVMAKGVLYFKKPQMLRFEITDPYHSILITNGRAVAQYERIDDQWEKLRSGGVGAIQMVTKQISSWLQGKLQQDNNAYTISADAEHPNRVHLVPIDPEFLNHIKRIDITFDQEFQHINEIKLHEPSGDFTRIQFISVQKSIAIPSDAFNTSGRTPEVLVPHAPAPTNP